jgi:hypothetical protein
MALSTLTGSCWVSLRRTIPGFREVAEDRVVLVGVRDLAPYQRDRLERSAVAVAYCGEAETLSIEQTSLAHIAALASRVDGLYVHIDFDSLDDSYGRANEYAAPFGLRVEQLASIVAAASARLPVRALTFTAYDPTLDADGRFAAVALWAIEEVRAGDTAALEWRCRANDWVLAAVVVEADGHPVMDVDPVRVDGDDDRRRSKVTGADPVRRLVHGEVDPDGARALNHQALRDCRGRSHFPSSRSPGALVRGSARP